MLSGENKIDEECFINIVQTAVAINNIGRESNGYILVGVSDTKATADRVKTLYPRFYVSTSKSIIKALINMHSFEIQLSPIG
ncbi:hypothetical protein BO179_004474 [Shigella flexneri]|nr:hypothetical protein [Escherichia coli]EFF2298800.1 hypothetical protein [Escherichia coli]EFZ1824633.1 hypothetical protein [Shigella flexneri]EFZ1825736.1 hypothetical protein [Shigella flexneri]